MTCHAPGTAQQAVCTRPGRSMEIREVWANTTPLEADGGERFPVLNDARADGRGGVVPRSRRRVFLLLSLSDRPLFRRRGR